jgi:hypothetical protein
MSGHPTSERATTLKQPWWEILPCDLPRDVHDRFSLGIRSQPELPLARKWVNDCVPFIFYVLRSYGGAWWYVWTDADVYTNRCVLSSIDGVRRRFEKRENAVKAVDAEIRKLEQR